MVSLMMWLFATDKGYAVASPQEGVVYALVELLADTGGRTDHSGRYQATGRIAAWPGKSVCHAYAWYRDGDVWVVLR